MTKKEIPKFKFIKEDNLVGAEYDFTSWMNMSISNNYIDTAQFTIQPSLPPPNINYVNYNLETNRLEYYCPIDNIYKEINT